ncbi:hypothetical protein C0991_011531 [Blastosporella zonata]|nr:hypothetical protein C0991_011531 [Blastosporella zonata]
MDRLTLNDNTSAITMPITPEETPSRQPEAPEDEQMDAPSPPQSQLVGGVAVEAATCAAMANKEQYGLTASGESLQASDFDRVGGNRYLRKLRDGSGYLIFYKGENFFVEWLSNATMKECLIYNAKLWGRDPQPGLKVPVGYLGVANAVNKDCDCPWGMVYWDESYSGWVVPTGKDLPDDRDISVKAPTEGDIAAYKKFTDDFVDKKTREFKEGKYNRFKDCFKEVAGLNQENSRLDRERRALKRERDRLAAENSQLKKRKRFVGVYEEGGRRGKVPRSEDGSSLRGHTPGSPYAASVGPSWLRR